MNVIKMIASSVAAVLTSGCCTNPFTFNVSTHQLSYCNFEKINGVRPSPDHVRAWVKEPDATSFRLMVAHSVLLHGMEHGGASTRRRYAEVYLHVYSDMTAGRYGRELDIAELSSEGDILGTRLGSKFLASDISNIYFTNAENWLNNRLKERMRVDPFDWLVGEMKTAPNDSD
jgi:hypothetical protein